MSNVRSWLSCFGALLSCLLAAALVPGVARAAETPPLEKTLSPYFQVEGGDPRVDSLPLLKTRVEVTVSGTIAAVTVRQVYKNDGKRPINARYVFPASTRAAVHGMKMRLKNREIKAKIRERKKARAQYAQAKKQGKTAALLEQERPNVFTMSVANVMPLDRIEVTLFYTEILVPSEGVYEFVYPTVVGPRYSSEPERTAQESDLWVKSPYQRSGKRPSYDFELSARVTSALPIASLSVPTHKVKQTPRGNKTIDVTLAPADKSGGNRDFVLRYQLLGNAIQSGISLFEQGNEKFFMAMVQPPKRPVKAEIPRREYVFVLDVSGSMHGFPLDTAKKLLGDLVGDLDSRDRFNVLLFSGGSALMSERSVPATEANVKRAEAFVTSIQGGGGTELLAALKRALALPAERGMSRSFVVVTDGYIAAERDVFDHIRAELGRANVFSFGIGSGVNRYLIDGIARAGLGEPFIVTSESEASVVAKRFRRYVGLPVLTNVRVDFDGFDAYDVEPQALPDVFVERPVVLFGKWRGQPSGKLALSGTTGKGRFEKILDVGQVRPEKTQRALRYLWARTRVANLSDFAFGELGAAEKAEVTRLGLGYDLLTQYTSFIAVSREVRNTGAPGSDVDQPLPIPAGVSELAVGGPLMGADEPPILWLLAMSLILAGAALAFGFSRVRAE